MRAVIQRVKEARVEIEGAVVGKISKGLLIFLGVGENDTEKECEYMANKIANLRIFPDQDDLMNLSIMDIKGAALIVSQFTLWGDCRKGRRPSFIEAARPEKAIPLYERFIELIKKQDIEVATGRFQETMDVHIVNDGPVTILIDSEINF
ncbi:MAG: D-tyrosyl-tRNA(Tyr) deacylase [Deltaproteobacteria bacterium]|nr:D-tyrosyl-tRNA(Tyr) deacylase [Deltaproteobacteria bacterium]